MKGTAAVPSKAEEIESVADSSAKQRRQREEQGEEQARQSELNAIKEEMTELLSKGEWFNQKRLKTSFSGLIFPCLMFFSGGRELSVCGNCRENE